MSIRLLVVVDVRLYRDGLAHTLAGRERFVVVDAVATRGAARDAVKTLAPDVVIVDMAVAEALDLIRDIRRERPAASVVAFAVNEVTADIIRCAEAGAASYVTADASLDELAAAIWATVSGELVCTPRIAGELFRRLGLSRSVRAGLAYPFLTSREHEVLEHIGRGLSNKEIGQQMCLAVSTVKNHVHHLLAKLGVRTRAEAAARAHGRRQVAPDGSRSLQAG